MSRIGLQSFVLGGMIAASVSAQTLIQKPPDLGLAHEPLSNSFGDFVFANSFVAPADDTVVTELGAWLINLFGGNGAVIAFQVWGEDPSTGGPNWQDVIASTDDFATTASALILHTFPVTSGEARLAPGQRYWFVATAAGRQGDGGYGLGGHTQNSVVQDNGTHWRSNDPNGQVFNFQNQLPEFAFEVHLAAPVVPTASEVAVLMMGLMILAASTLVLRRQQDSALRATGV